MGCPRWLLVGAGYRKGSPRTRHPYFGVPEGSSPQTGRGWPVKRGIVWHGFAIYLRTWQRCAVDGAPGSGRGRSLLRWRRPPSMVLQAPPARCSPTTFRACGHRGEGSRSTWKRQPAPVFASSGCWSSASSVARSAWLRVNAAWFSRLRNALSRRGSVGVDSTSDGVRRHHHRDRRCGQSAADFPPRSPASSS